MPEVCPPSAQCPPQPSSSAAGPRPSSNQPPTSCAGEPVDRSLVAVANAVEEMLCRSFEGDDNSRAHRILKKLLKCDGELSLPQAALKIAQNTRSDIASHDLLELVAGHKFVSDVRGSLKRDTYDSICSIESSLTAIEMLCVKLYLRSTSVLIRAAANGDATEQLGRAVAAVCYAVSRRTTRDATSESIESLRQREIAEVLLRALLEAGADPDATLGGYTGLHWLVAAGAVHGEGNVAVLMRVLREYGANIDIQGCHDDGGLKAQMERVKDLEASSAEHSKRVEEAQELHQAAINVVRENEETAASVPDDLKGEAELAVLVAKVRMRELADALKSAEDAHDATQRFLDTAREKVAEVETVDGAGDALEAMAKLCNGMRVMAIAAMLKYEKCIEALLPGMGGGL